MHDCVLVISLPKMPYIHRVCKVMANPNYVQWQPWLLQLQNARVGQKHTHMVRVGQNRIYIYRI